MTSFFDSVTSNLIYKKENKKENYFKKIRVLSFYKDNYTITEEDYDNIGKFCDSRNENPLCHSNIKIVKNKNMKKKIEEESEKIIRILNSNCNK